LQGPALDIGSSKYHDTNNTALNSTLRAMASLDNDVKLDISGGFHANRMKNGQTSSNFAPDGKLSFDRNYDTNVRVLGGHTSGQSQLPDQC
jgi:hypothetical protein